MVQLSRASPELTCVISLYLGAAEAKSRDEESPASGYYYQGVWHAPGGEAVRQFDTPAAVTQCLKGKVVHLYGDSTIRQWYEHLVTTVPGSSSTHISEKYRVIIILMLLLLSLKSFQS